MTQDNGARETADQPVATHSAADGGAEHRDADTSAPAIELDEEQRRGLEALLFLADEPLIVAELAEVLEASPASVEQALHDVAATYERDRRGIEVRAVAGGWRMYTAAAAHPIVERWALAGKTGRLTQAALETLAVITYKQPISRQGIGDIRGVNADGAVRSLVARGLVTEVGRDDGPGQAVLYGTTPLLLERLGVQSLDELPPLTDYLPEAPAPDEPELGTLRDVRRRLAEGGQLPSLGGRSAEETNTGPDAGDSDDDADLLPPPVRSVGEGRRDDEIEALAERLESAARNAVDRLRAVMESDPDQDDDGADHG